MQDHSLKAKARVLVLGLDSADPRLLNKWCDSGDLPVLNHLRARSCWGELTGPRGLADDGVWASFSTCVSPARHGRYFTKSLSTGSYRNPNFQDEDLKHETFWSALGRAGHRLAVIDVPKSPLAVSFDGVQIKDWIVHGRDGAMRSWPHDVAGQLLRRFGHDATDDPASSRFLCRLLQVDEHAREALLADLLKSIELKVAVALELLAQGDWDMFLTVFKECHCVAHQFWHTIDVNHPSHETASSGTSPIKTIYRAIDVAIGRLLEAVGPEAAVIVFSGLGMAANYSGEHLLDEVLKRIERADNSRYRNTRASIGYAVHGLLGQLMRGRYEPTPQRFRQAYQVAHNEMSGAIRINLKGREPGGRINRGREFDRLCASLTTHLLALENPETGEAVVQEVLRVDKLFKGEHLDTLPDLLVVWKRSAPINGVRSEKIGVIDRTLAPRRPGNHVEGGFYFISGPEVLAGERREPASVTDIGPTIGDLLGSPLSGVDGESILVRQHATLR